YRGYYERLAVEPASNVTVGEMLADLRGAIGATYEGYKGGEYEMGEWSDVYLAEYGTCGEELGVRLLRYMIAEAKAATSDEELAFQLGRTESAAEVSRLTARVEELEKERD